MIGKLAVAALKIYQAVFSPILSGLGCRCRFYPTCSDYARDAFGKKNTFKALSLVVIRMLKCGPWHDGGVDFVPGTRKG
jgi:putative membrane protein insertion efficiency factor